MGASLFDTYEQAERLRKVGQLQESADLCRQMLHQDPGFAHAYHLMSDLFRSTGNIEKALHFSSISIQLSPLVYEFHLHQAELFFQLGRWSDASQAYAQAGHLSPGSAAPLIGRADCSARMAEFDQAREAYAQARAMGAQGQADLHEAGALTLGGQWAAAEALYDRVLGSRPHHVEAHVHKGRLLLMQGRDAQAESCFARAVAYRRHCVEAMHGLAMVSERRGDLDMAIELVLQSVKTNTDLFDGLALLGSLLLRKQNFSSAEEVFRQALHIAPYQIYAMHGLVLSLAAQDKTGQALQYIEEQLGTSPDREALAFLQASLRAGRPPVDSGYHARWFDDYARRFGCRFTPRQSAVAVALVDALRALPREQGKDARTLLDLGCGMGAAASLLGPAVGLRVGVDVSLGMIDQARARGLYAECYALDAVEFIMGSDRTFDWIAAADMLPYVGDLGPFFSGVRNVMADGSVLAVSFEHGEPQNGCTLSPSGRYRHAPSYVDALAGEMGLRVLSQDALVTRNELSQPVKMTLVLFEKQAMH